MPANSVSPYPTDDGPAIKMEPEDHRQTASWGNSAEAQTYRAKQAGLIRTGRYDDAVQMDIDDLQRKFGTKYDRHIGQLIDALPPDRPNWGLGKK